MTCARAGRFGMSDCFASAEGRPLAQMGEEPGSPSFEDGGRGVGWGGKRVGKRSKLDSRLRQMRGEYRDGMHQGDRRFLRAAYGDVI